MKDRSGGRVYMMSAFLAAIRFTAGDKVMLGINDTATLAGNPVGVTICE